ncbi:hypothetical protein CRG98_023998 [Punica granatum]|uniref:Uncharacterized protein n=1 Tax=Punica granatum TaxID=22663 RepID=A0A2I0JH83_PUNGR|nr:hypothetical protein CRG98_023998 [Punica granatum]
MDLTNLDEPSRLLRDKFLTALSSQDEKSYKENRKGRKGRAADSPPRSPVPTEDASDLSGGVGVADWRPQPRINWGLPQPRIDWGPPTRSPWSIRGWGRQSVTPTPPPRSSASFVGTDDLGGGVGVRVADWRPRPLPDPLFPFDFFYRTKMKQN